MPVVRYDECSVKGTIEYDKPQTGWRIEVDIIGAVFQGNYRKQKFPPFAAFAGRNDRSEISLFIHTPT